MRISLSPITRLYLSNSNRLLLPTKPLLPQNLPKFSSDSISPATSIAMAAESENIAAAAESENLAAAAESESIAAAAESESIAAAAESKSLATAVITEEDAAKYGFERAEMYSSNLAGTVGFYERHVFVCYRSHDVWPAVLEKSDSDPLPQMYLTYMKKRSEAITIKPRLTICEPIPEANLMHRDVLVFPEMNVYRGLTLSDVDTFVEDILVRGEQVLDGTEGKIDGSFVFVCAHTARDKRCGVCGPPLIEKFKEEIQSQNLADRVFVTACSHIGGHKYAGNVIIFSAGPDGKVAGNWYGYVTPSDVAELLDKQIGKGEVVERIWRGQMGVKAPEKVEEPKLTNGTTNTNHAEQEPKEIGGGEQAVNAGGCCQGANGGSCCQDNRVEKTADKNECSSWIGKWEQRNLLTTVAVVGAVATVAVAYGMYRRAR